VTTYGLCPTLYSVYLTATSLVSLEGLDVANSSMLVNQAEAAPGLVLQISSYHALRVESAIYALHVV